MTAPRVSRSRPTKPRRSRADIRAIRETIAALLEADNPMTVRQVFYRLVSIGVIEKTEREYKGTVVRLLGDMRLEREIPFAWIADHTRWMRKPSTHTGLADLLQSQAQTYRRDLWSDQSAYVEVWLEKDALAGVLYPETEEWDVPLMVTRGYPSLSYLSEAAHAIRSERKPTFLYYFGDLDPSGVDIPRSIERNLRELAPDAEIHFKRVAVNPDQIEEFGLPTRPTKGTDSRIGGFVGESVEVDAIPPAELRAMVRACIVRHVNRRTLDETRRIESLERETLAGLRLPESPTVWTKDRAWDTWFKTGRADDVDAWRRAVAAVGSECGAHERAFGPEEWERVARFASEGGAE